MNGCVILLKSAFDLKILVSLLVPLLHLFTLLDLLLNLLKLQLALFYLSLELYTSLYSLTLLTKLLLEQ
jgi:hypothetical protein